MNHENEKFDYLIALCHVEGGSFRNTYRELEKAKKEELQDMQKNFIKNSPGYKAKEEQIETEFAKKVADLRRETSETLKNAIEAVRDAEMARVMNVQEASLAKIRAVADIPMTKAELSALMEKYNINNNYWSARLFMEIAEKNAIDTSDMFEPTYDVKMSVLDQLAYQADRLINYYPDDRHWESDGAEIRHGYLTSITLPALSEAFYGSTNIVSDNSALVRFEAKLKTKNTDFEKGVVIGEYLRNARGDKRNEALFSIAMNNDISERAAQLSGYASEISAFKTGKAEMYLNAKKAMESLSGTDSEERKQEIIESNSSNEFFLSFLGKKRKAEKVQNDMAGVTEE